MKRLTNAIVRKPGNNFPNGISSSGLGKPSVEKALKQHKAYYNTLKQCGLNVQILEADKNYPDGCFVEDTAVITDNMAVITKPGDPARLGEEKKIEEILKNHKKIKTIELPGNVDGGDIFRVDNHFYIGISGRTNEEGARQLTEILSNYGYTSSKIPVKSFLHLKTGVACIGGKHILSIDKFAEFFSSFNVVKVEPDEQYAANCLLINDFLLVPAGFPKTKQKLMNLGYDIIEIEMSEFQKMDGGLTCLSLLF
ncbi:MAG: arginine deiminase family protein [Bacteroidales bacterium]